MPRIALAIEYDGSAYNGWQRQKNGYGVQEELEKALAKVATHPIEVFCAGRTDTGVHGLAQVVHFDTTVERPDKAWVLGTNIHARNDMNVVWAKQVDPEFHARFSAESRRYRYVMLDRRARSAIWMNRAAHLHQSVDAELMNEAARYFIGRHDFTSFRAAECQAAHPIREVLDCRVSRQGEMVYLDIEAHAFLHNMVRNIAGTLLEVGLKKQRPDWVKDVIAIKDRAKAGSTAPACGLYFVAANYDQKWGIPQTITNGLDLNP